MIQTIKLEHSFDAESWILKMVSKMIVSFLITIWNNKVDVKHLNFDFFYGCLEA